MNAPDDGGMFDCRPILCVQSVAQSIRYYVETLGFRLGWAWDTPRQRFLEHCDDGVPTFALAGATAERRTIG